MDIRLHCDNLSVHVDGKQILDHISFQVGSGEFLGIIGPNGAGKSTLFKTILGLLELTNGQIRMSGDGHDLKRFSSTIGYVPQTRQLDADTPIRARDFIALNLPGRFRPWMNRSDKQLIAEAFRLADAEHLMNKSVGAMSGGEKQKVFLAQALVRKPRILMLDEPTASLDPGAQEQMASTVARICREWQMGVLFISHDINLIAQYADRILFLTKGQHAIGDVDQIMHPSVLSQLYGFEVRITRNGPHYVVLPADQSAAAPICFHEETNPMMETSGRNEHVRV